MATGHGRHHGNNSKANHLRKLPDVLIVTIFIQQTNRNMQPLQKMEGLRIPDPS
jgi:hypothetical protein